MQAYARLARLPQPTLAATEVAPLVRRARPGDPLPIEVRDGPEVTADLDAARSSRC